MLQVDGGHVYYLNGVQSSFVKVNCRTYEQEEVPLTGYKVFQIAVAQGRVYAIGEDGTLEVAFPKGDTLGQNFKPVMKAKDESDEEDEVAAKGKDYERKAVRIEDIPEDVVDLPDAHNASILAGSDAEEDEQEEHPLPDSSKERSLLKSILGDKDKKRKPE